MFDVSGRKISRRGPVKARTRKKISIGLKRYYATGKRKRARTIKRKRATHLRWRMNKDGI